MSRNSNNTYTSDFKQNSPWFYTSLTILIPRAERSALIRTDPHSSNALIFVLFLSHLAFHSSGPSSGERLGPRGEGDGGYNRDPGRVPLPSEVTGGVELSCGL